VSNAPVSAAHHDHPHPTSAVSPVLSPREHKLCPIPSRLRLRFCSHC
jgi:hypothetical protein